ncbi:MAG TPA: putative O-glycosylation ligase, exosortase A system-associated [Chromatiales bacterium]|nr:putative O-glycosylation ligase, exosortase A system-associated [Chromatiales bacterium]
MRDLFVLAVVFGSVPVILARPWIGVLVWSWIAYMNPHRLAWGIARDFPVAMTVGVTTLVALLLTRDRRPPPLTRETVVLALFTLWMVVTTLFALEPDAAQVQLEKVLKIQLFTFVTMMLVFTRERIHWLVWAIVLSIGFYGVKGGIFTLTTGGAHRVLGPYGTFIGGNNEIGLAMIMVLPLMRYLQLQAKRVWERNLWWAAMGLTGIAILGTHSRGALVGVLAMLAMLAWRTRRKLLFVLVLAALAPAAWDFMPEKWHARMETIDDYQEDGSAQGRLNAWRFAFNLALDRPLTGGGFETFRPRWFALYAPNPYKVHDAHSIYFEVLGEHGFVGLALFLLLGTFTWLKAGRIRRLTRRREELLWAHDLASMLQVSLVGYAVAGAFLGLAYFDLYYALVALTVMLGVIVRDQAHAPQDAPQPARAVGAVR